jgi:spore maturation protein CgeB
VRALVVHPGPNFSVADVYRGWVKGLRANGVQVAELNLDERLSFYGQAHLKKHGRWFKAFENEAAFHMAAKGLEVACYEWWPDLVVIVSGFFIPPQMYAVMRGRGHTVVLVHTESPYEDTVQLRRAPHADFSVLNDPTNLERFREVTRAAYIPHAYDPDIHHPKPPVEGCGSDVFFVGTGYPSRIEFLEAVNWRGINLALAGNWQKTQPRSKLRRRLIHPIKHCFDNTEAIDWYASTKTSFNLYRKEETEQVNGWSIGPREVELAACGRFFAREPRPEGDELFPMLPTFTEPGELGDILRHYLRHDSERDEAAIKAREAVADRTFANNAAELLRLLGA